MKYIVEISLAENSKIVKSVNSPYYKSNGKFDIVVFSSKSITIEAERGKSYSEEDIFNNVQNSLYNQMFKVILFHYAVNGGKSAVIRITVTILMAGKQKNLIVRDFGDNDQPLPISEPVLPLNEHSLELLMEETDDAYNLRLTIVHWLSAMGESDKKNRLECLWRAFERICIYRRHRNRDEIPYVSKALLEMKNELRVHSSSYQHSMSIAHLISYEDLRKLMWHDLIEGSFKNRYDFTNPKEKRIFKQKYIDDFVNQFDDKRVVTLLYETLNYLKSELNEVGEMVNVESSLMNKISANVNRDADVLALMACNYAYFLRIRLFHGHSLVKCSIFDKHADKMGVGMTARILETLVAELINNFRNL